MTEFSRIYDLSLPSALMQMQKIIATPEECEALARRFHILAVKDVSAEFKILHDQEEGCFKIDGRLKGSVIQASIVSQSPVEELIEEVLHIKIRLLAPDEDYDENIIDELDDLSEDIEYIKEGKVDVGELVAQYLALSLNPYPRNEGESLGDNSHHEDEGENEKRNPFDILSTLKKS